MLIVNEARILRLYATAVNPSLRPSEAASSGSKLLRDISRIGAQSGVMQAGGCWLNLNHKPHLSHDGKHIRDVTGNVMRSNEDLIEKDRHSGRYAIPMRCSSRMSGNQVGNTSAHQVFCCKADVASRKVVPELIKG